MWEYLQKWLELHHLLDAEQLLEAVKGVLWRLRLTLVDLCRAATRQRVWAILAAVRTLYGHPHVSEHLPSQTFGL